jgi:hypothetical protein
MYREFFGTRVGKVVFGELIDSILIVFKPLGLIGDLAVPM